jgi:hypothetical protein
MPAGKAFVGQVKRTDASRGQGIAAFRAPYTHPWYKTDRHPVHAGSEKKGLTLAGDARSLSSPTGEVVTRRQCQEPLMESS